jgi:hypothetical protein
MTPEVQQAIIDLREVFSGHPIEVIPEAQGGAYVIVSEVTLGESFTPSVTWFGFYITFQYPGADIYPHFMGAEVKKANDCAIRQDGVSGPTAWQGRAAVQLSRRSNRWNPAVDTAALKLLKVIEWVKSK